MKPTAGTNELRDFRGRITQLTWVYVEAEHRSTGQDAQEIVREILHAWAQRKHCAYSEAQKLLAGAGLAGNARE